MGNKNHTCPLPLSNETRLRSGFVAEAGSEFRAYIDDIPFCSLTKWEMDSVIPHAMVFPLGVENIAVTNSEHKIVVYPNPSAGAVTFVFPAYGRYCIYNQLGQSIKILELREGDSLEVLLEIGGDGLYYLVSLNKQIQSVKFIIKP